MEYKLELVAIKIAVVGNTCVGKSPIINSYISGEPKLDAISMTEEKFQTKFKLKNGKEIKLVLLDASGYERFRATTLRYSRNCHGVILVFSLTEKRSFDNI